MVPSGFWSGLWNRAHVDHVSLSTEAATCSSLASDDWALNMEICDAVNSSEDGSVAPGLISVHRWCHGSETVRF